MPTETKVHKVVEAIKAKGEPGVNPYAVAQAVTHQNYHTGEPIKHAQEGPEPHLWQQHQGRTPTQRRSAKLDLTGEEKRKGVAEHARILDELESKTKKDPTKMASHENDLTLNQLADKGKKVMSNQTVHPNMPPIGDYLANLPEAKPTKQMSRTPAEPQDDKEPEEEEVRGTEPLDEVEAQEIDQSRHGESAIQFCPHCGGHIGMDPAVVESEPLKEAAGGFGTFHPKPQVPGQLKVSGRLGGGLSGNKPTGLTSEQHKTESALGRGYGEGTGDTRSLVGPNKSARFDHPFQDGRR